MAALALMTGSMIVVAEIARRLQSGLNRRLRLQSQWSFNRRRQGMALHLCWSQRKSLAGLAFAFAQKKRACSQDSSGAAKAKQKPPANPA